MARRAKIKKVEKRAISSSSNSLPDWYNIRETVWSIRLYQIQCCLQTMEFHSFGSQREAYASKQPPTSMATGKVLGRKWQRENWFMQLFNRSNLQLQFAHPYPIQPHGLLWFSRLVVFSEKKIFINSHNFINPLSGAFFKLPHLTCRRCPRSLWKNCAHGELVLSKDPSLGSFEILTSNYDHNVIAHLKFGDEFRSYSERTNGQNYKFAVCKDGIVSLEVINDGGYDGIVRISGEFSSSPELMKLCGSKSTFYLAENTKGDLLTVRRYTGQNDFKIYKIVDLNGRFEYIRVRNLDGHSLLMGNKNPILVLASNYSVYYSLANTYWIEDEAFYPNVIGFYEFDLEDKNQVRFKVLKY